MPPRPIRASLSAAVATLGALAASAQTAIQTFNGSEVGSQRGRSVAGGADFDQDGWSDIVIGAPLADGGSQVDNGVVRVMSGQTGNALWVRNGVSDGDQFGRAVAVTSDTDGDNVRDVLVGAPLAMSGGVRKGMVRLFSGATGTLLFTWYGDDEGDQFGYSVDGSFDTDHDNRSDVIVGAPTGNFNGLFTSGYARTFSGATGVELFTFVGAATSATGWAVSGCGDVDNDGRRDFAVGMPGASGHGAVLVFDGDSTNAASTILRTFSGIDPGDAFGVAVAGDLDGNNDGFDDVIVGAYLANHGSIIDTGSVTLFSGANSAVLQRWYGELGNDRLGESATSMRSVNPNGARDVLAGAAAGNYVRVFDSTLGDVLLDIPGDAAGDSMGQSVAEGGDFNNDGTWDFVVGAPASDPSGLGSAGFARVYSSAPWAAHFCTAGTTTNGCTARMTTSGTASAGASSGFVLAATGVEGAKSGLVFYGLSGRIESAWGTSSSWLCVKAPTQRTVLASSGGTANACNGTISVDWLAFLAANPSALGNPLVVGQLVGAQCWFRDPPSPKTTSLSDAVEFPVAP